MEVTIQSQTLSSSPSRGTVLVPFPSPAVDQELQQSWEEPPRGAGRGRWSRRDGGGAVLELQQRLLVWEAPPATLQGLDGARSSSRCSIPRVTPGNPRALRWGQEALPGGKLAGK